MTLNTNEIVYTADLMNISPANDAQIYGKDGNYILSGLEIRAVTSTSATLTAGRAIIQGRLFELKANTQYTLTAGTSQYLGLEIDLTKENKDDGMGNITNNQFTVKSNDREYGDTRLGDIQSFVAFHKVDTQAQTSQPVTFKLNDEIDLTHAYGDVGFPPQKDIKVIKRGKNVQIHGVVTNLGDIAPDGKEYVMRVLPVGFRPKYDVFYSTSYAGHVLELIIRSNGDITMKNFSGVNFEPMSAWLNLSSNITID